MFYSLKQIGSIGICCHRYIIEARCYTRCMSAGMNADGIRKFRFWTIDAVFAISAIAFINLLSFQPVK